jgi:hypothetical protein
VYCRFRMPGELGRGKKGDPMKILAGIVGSILLSLAATSAGAVIMFSPTPSGTGNNVVFISNHPTRPELRSSATSMLPTRWCSLRALRS